MCANVQIQGRAKKFSSFAGEKGCWRTEQKKNFFAPYTEIENATYGAVIIHDLLSQLTSRSIIFYEFYDLICENYTPGLIANI